MGRVEEKRAGCRVRRGAKQRGLRRRWSSSHRPSTCYCRRRRRFWASTSRRFSPARLRSPLPALRPQASLPSPSPPHSAPAPPSVCGARDNQQCPRVLTSLLVYRRPPTTRAAQKSSTRKRRAAASSADPSVAIPVMAASVSPGVSSAARKASRLNPSCAATSHSCSAQPHAPEAGVSRAPLLSAPRTETESSSVSAPPGVRRGGLSRFPMATSASRPERRVEQRLSGNGELSSAALAKPSRAVLGSSPQPLGLEHPKHPSRRFSRRPSTLPLPSSARTTLGDRPASQADACSRYTRWRYPVLSIVRIIPRRHTLSLAVYGLRRILELRNHGQPALGGFVLGSAEAQATAPADRKRGD